MISMAFLPQISRYKECFYEKQSAFIPSLHLYSDCFSACRLFFRRFDFRNSKQTVKQKAFLRKQLPKHLLKVNLQRLLPLPLLLLKKRICLSSRTAIDEALQQEASAGYSFEEPNVIVNPYGNSPLTAVAAFHTDKELGGTVTVKGKDEKNDITGTFEAATDHLVPIYGLYNGATTEVVLTLEDGTSTTVEVTTEKLISTSARSRQP